MLRSSGNSFSVFLNECFSKISTMCKYTTVVRDSNLKLIDFKKIQM